MRQPQATCSVLGMLDGNECVLPRSLRVEPEEKSQEYCQERKAKKDSARKRSCCFSRYGVSPDLFTNRRHRGRLPPADRCFRTPPEGARRFLSGISILESGFP